ncbi:hypothetical protein ACFL56_01120 [Candidatus Margulisiibacteriota bacterium]
MKRILLIIFLVIISIQVSANTLVIDYGSQIVRDQSRSFTNIGINLFEEPNSPYALNLHMVSSESFFYYYRNFDYYMLWGIPTGEEEKTIYSGLSGWGFDFIWYLDQNKNWQLAFGADSLSVPDIGGGFSLIGFMTGIGEMKKGELITISEYIGRISLGYSTGNLNDPLRFQVKLIYTFGKVVVDLVYEDDEVTIFNEHLDGFGLKAGLKWTFDKLF